MSQASVVSPSAALSMSSLNGLIPPPDKYRCAVVEVRIYHRLPLCSKLGPPWCRTYNYPRRSRSPRTSASPARSSSPTSAISPTFRAPACLPDLCTDPPYPPLHTPQTARPQAQADRVPRRHRAQGEMGVWRGEPSASRTPPLISSAFILTCSPRPAQSDRVSTCMTRFKRDATASPYMTITPDTPLAELERFLDENIFALGAFAHFLFFPASSDTPALVLLRPCAPPICSFPCMLPGLRQ
jgi:hypothetical protein